MVASRLLQSAKQLINDEQLSVWCDVGVSAVFDTLQDLATIFRRTVFLDHSESTAVSGLQRGIDLRAATNWIPQIAPLRERGLTLLINDERNRHGVSERRMTTVEAPRLWAADGWSQYSTAVLFIHDQPAIESFFGNRVKPTFADGQGEVCLSIRPCLSSLIQEELSGSMHPVPSGTRLFLSRLSTTAFVSLLIGQRKTSDITERKTPYGIHGWRMMYLEPPSAECKAAPLPLLFRTSSWRLPSCLRRPGSLCRESLGNLRGSCGLGLLEDYLR